MTPFDQGWRDRMLEVPPRPNYRRTLPAVQYERGRHAASLWMFELSVALRTRGQPGTINARAVERRWDYDTARRLMSRELKEAIDAEMRFCSRKSELLA